MKTYTLTSYEPIHVELPKPQVPENLVDEQIKRMIEPFSKYEEIAELRSILMGDFLVITTENAGLDDSDTPHFEMNHSLYHIGSGTMPQSFDKEIIGMVPGETKHIEAEIKLPSSLDGKPSILHMDITIEKILNCTLPELSDAFVVENFAPATTVAEFRNQVAGEFSLPDMAKDDSKFPDLVLAELAKRLVEEVDESDLLDGQPFEALRATCAIDALADYLNIQLTDEQITAQMPSDDPDQRRKIREQLDSQGLGDEAFVFARREAALSWLVNNSSVSYR